MCRMMAITQFDFSLHRELCESFFALSETGMVMAGDQPGHLDGWGIGYYVQDDALVYKFGMPFDMTDAHCFDFLDQIGKSKLVILHLRKSAWQDRGSARHAHPFIDHQWVMAHNGTVRDYDQLIPNLLPEFGVQDDALDTEVYFHYILSRCHGRGFSEGFCDAVQSIRAERQYSALNTLITDGQQLIAYRDYSGHPDYYSLYVGQVRDSVVVCSEMVAPIGHWRLMSDQQMLCWDLVK